jgi:hypothetical protein
MWNPLKKICKCMFMLSFCQNKYTFWIGFGLTSTFHDWAGFTIHIIYLMKRKVSVQDCWTLFDQFLLFLQFFFSFSFKSKVHSIMFLLLVTLHLLCFYNESNRCHHSLYIVWVCFVAVFFFYVKRTWSWIDRWSTMWIRFSIRTKTKDKYPLP